MEYDRRKFLKIGGAAAVGLAVATALEASNETSATAQVATATPTTLCTDLIRSPVATPTPGPSCSSTCPLPTPMPTPISGSCPAPQSGHEADTTDPGNICLIKQTVDFAQLEVQQIIGMIMQKGCGKNDYNLARVTAIQDLLSDAANQDSTDDELDVIALLLYKIKIPKQRTNFPRPPGRNESVNCLLDYISALLADLFARLQGECFDANLASLFQQGVQPPL